MGVPAPERGPRRSPHLPGWLANTSRNNQSRAEGRVVRLGVRTLQTDRWTDSC